MRSLVLVAAFASLALTASAATNLNSDFDLNYFSQSKTVDGVSCSYTGNYGGNIQGTYNSDGTLTLVSFDAVTANPNFFDWTCSAIEIDGYVNATNTTTFNNQYLPVINAVNTTDNNTILAFNCTDSTSLPSGKITLGGSSDATSSSSSDGSAYIPILLLNGAEGVELLTEDGCSTFLNASSTIDLSAYTFTGPLTGCGFSGNATIAVTSSSSSNPSVMVTEFDFTKLDNSALGANLGETETQCSGRFNGASIALTGCINSTTTNALLGSTLYVFNFENGDNFVTGDLVPTSGSDEEWCFATLGSSLVQLAAWMMLVALTSQTLFF